MIFWTHFLQWGVQNVIFSVFGRLSRFRGGLGGGRGRRRDHQACAGSAEGSASIHGELLLRLYRAGYVCLFTAPQPEGWDQTPLSRSATLYRLHKAILNAFDLEDEHAHAFFLSNQWWNGYNAFASMKIRGDERLTGNWRLDRAGLVKGSRFKYLFRVA